jgi:hypothetical protein
MLSSFLSPGLTKETPPPLPTEHLIDRLDHDLIGLSDADAMWYYERRKWRGRD